MGNNAVPAALGTPFVQDPRISLMKFLSSNWGKNSNIANLPEATSIIFDTKFGRLTKPNVIVVEKMPTTIRPQVLGASRFSYSDNYRVQIYCENQGAINRKFLMEQEIERIIQTNVKGMLSDGVERVLINGFQEIYVTNDAKISQGIATPEAITIARSYAIVSLYYDKVNV